MAVMDDTPRGTAAILPFVRQAKASPTSAPPQSEPTVDLPVSALIQFVGVYLERMQSFATLHNDVLELIDMASAGGIQITNKAGVVALTTRSQAIVQREAEQLRRLLEQLAMST